MYDLYKLSDEIIYDDSFYQLFDDVKRVRADDTECLSAKPEYELKQLLVEVCDKNYFKKDYEDITSTLLFEKVDYFTVKNNLIKIIEHLKD